jgi:hypothetical protein
MESVMPPGAVPEADAQAACLAADAQAAATVATAVVATTEVIPGASQAVAQAAAMVTAVAQAAPGGRGKWKPPTVFESAPPNPKAATKQKKAKWSNRTSPYAAMLSSPTMGAPMATTMVAPTWSTTGYAPAEPAAGVAAPPQPLDDEVSKPPPRKRKKKEDTTAAAKEAPPLLPCEPPAGFKFAASPPTEEQLAFSQGPSPADELVGRSILLNWQHVGWCMGTITERNTSARAYKMIDGEKHKVNFLVYYEIDQETVKTLLRLDEYGGEDEASWLLLEPEVAAADEGAAAGSAAAVEAPVTGEEAGAGEPVAPA